jgi:hypothetical protein
MIINIYLIFVHVFEKKQAVKIFSVIYIKLYDYLNTNKIKLIVQFTKTIYIENWD